MTVDIPDEICKKYEKKEKDQHVYTIGGSKLIGEYRGIKVYSNPSCPAGLIQFLKGDLEELEGFTVNL